MDVDESIFKLKVEQLSAGEWISLTSKWAVLVYGVGTYIPYLIKKHSSIYPSIPKKRQDQIRSRVQAMVNSVVSSSLSLMWFFSRSAYAPSWLRPVRLWLEAGNIKHFAAIMLAYVANDVWNKRAVIFTKGGVLHLAHHFVTGALSMIACWKWRHVAPAIAAWGLVEISSFFLDVMWFMREFKYDSSWPASYHMSIFLFVATFIATRIVWLPYASYNTLNTEPMATALRNYPSHVVMWGLVAVQWIFLYQIWRMVYKNFVLKYLIKSAPPVTANFTTKKKD